MATVKIVKCETEADAKERYKLMDSDYDICLVREGSFRGEGLSAKSFGFLMRGMSSV